MGKWVAVTGTENPKRAFSQTKRMWSCSAEDTKVINVALAVGEKPNKGRHRDENRSAVDADSTIKAYFRNRNFCSRNRYLGNMEY